MSEEQFSKEFFEEFLNFIPLSIVLIDGEDYIFEVNSQTESLSGYKKHELVDDKVEKIFTERDIEKLRRGATKEEMSIMGKDKKRRVEAFSEKFDNGMFIALSDLDRAKEMEREMEEKVKELERFNRLATGRELRMVELKRDKKKLEEGNDKLETKLKEIKSELEKIKKKNGKEG